MDFTIAISLMDDKRTMGPRFSSGQGASYSFPALFGAISIFRATPEDPGARRDGNPKVSNRFFGSLKPGGFNDRITRWKLEQLRDVILTRRLALFINGSQMWRSRARVKIYFG